MAMFLVGPPREVTFVPQHDLVGQNPDLGNFGHVDRGGTLENNGQAPHFKEVHLGGQCLYGTHGSSWRAPWMPTKIFFDHALVLRGVPRVRLRHFRVFKIEQLIEVRHALENKPFRQPASAGLVEDLVDFQKLAKQYRRENSSTSFTSLTGNFFEGERSGR